MDKTQFIKRIAELHPQLRTKDAEYAVKVMLDAMCSTLSKGGRIEIRGFGSFSLNRLPPKRKSNLKSGFMVNEPPKYIPHFKPAKELRARASNGSGAEIAELIFPLQLPIAQFDRETTNDIEQTANYA